MLTITINEAGLEHELKDLAAAHHTDPDTIVRDMLAVQLGRPEIATFNGAMFSEEAH